MHTVLLKYMNDSGKLYARMLLPAREASGSAQAELGRMGQQQFGALLFQGFSDEDRAELERLMDRVNGSEDWKKVTVKADMPLPSPIFRPKSDISFAECRKNTSNWARLVWN